MNERKWLRIKFQELEILHQNPTVEAYYSVTFNQKLYFSSVFDDQSTLEVKNDIIIPLQGKIVDSISLQSWESHVIVFDHQISLSQLKTKSIIKKRFQARKNQIITFTIKLCGENDILFCETLVRKVTQHYLFLENIKLKDQYSQRRGDQGPSYFKISTSKDHFDIPVENGNCLIYLPETFQISQFRNGKFYSSSKLFTFQQLSNNIEQIELYSQSNAFAGKISFDAHWIIDISALSPVQYLLLPSIQILLYQFQLKFDMPSDFVGSRMKVSCNNKLFQISDQLGNSKIIRIKKAVWIVCKSPYDFIEIKIQRNNQVISKISILAEQLAYCQLIKYKQKLSDASNVAKTLGFIKFNIQKSKGDSNLQNQTFWKQCTKKKSTGSILIEQISVCYDQDQNTSILIKTQNEQKRVDKLSNINFFQQQPLIYHNPVLLNPKPDETLYFMVKGEITNQNSDDFLGIAVMNFGDIKLGKSPYQIDFYKNQQKIGSVNCIITKYLALTFVKSIFQPQVLPSSKVIDLKLSINAMTLSPYFFSYKYDNQSQVFCIIQANKVKKVLILQPTYQELSFVPASSSDNLFFTVDVDEVIKIKITIMVGDGISQTIYGTYNTSIKMQEIRQKQQINKKQIQFINFTQMFVGKCNLIVNIQKQSNKRLQKSKSKQKIPFQNRNRSSNSKKQKKQKIKSISILQFASPQQKQEEQIKTIKNLLPTRKHAQKEINSSFNLDKKQTAQSKMIPKFESREAVKLPLIKQKKRKDSFNDLFVSMNVRKRTLGGYDYNKPLQDDKSLRDNQLSSRVVSKQKSIDYQHLRNNNPNMDRNFQILFPHKKGQTREQQIKNQLNKYQQKLKGLKSVLHQISNDIDPIEPTIKQGNRTDSASHGQGNFQYAGNEFL